MSLNIVAPMPGTVSEILVKDGDVVKADDELVILEAMKMENPICAPRDGKVKEGIPPPAQQAVGIRLGTLPV